MQVITCRYCRSEVSLTEVEREGGSCPECGATISFASSRYDDDDDDDLASDDFDETLLDEDDDDFDDE